MRLLAPKNCNLNRNWSHCHKIKGHLWKVSLHFGKKNIQSSKRNQENYKTPISTILAYTKKIHDLQFTFCNSPWRLNSSTRHSLALKTYRLNVQFTAKEMNFFRFEHINVTLKYEDTFFSIPFGVGHPDDEESRPPFFP